MTVADERMNQGIEEVAAIIARATAAAQEAGASYTPWNARRDNTRGWSFSVRWSNGSAPAAPEVTARGRHLGEDELRRAWNRARELAG